MDLSYVWLDTLPSAFMKTLRDQDAHTPILLELNDPLPPSDL